MIEHLGHTWRQLEHGLGLRGFTDALDADGGQLPALPKGYTGPPPTLPTPAAAAAAPAPASPAPKGAVEDDDRESDGRRPGQGRR